SNDKSLLWLKINLNIQRCDFMNTKTDNNKKGKSIRSLELFPRYVALRIYTKRDNVQGMYRNLLKLKPIYKKKPDYYYRLAKLAYRLKKWDQSLNHINVAIQLADDHSSSEFYLFKADSLIHLGETAEAISCLNEYLLVKP